MDGYTIVVIFLIGVLVIVFIACIMNGIKREDHDLIKTTLIIAGIVTVICISSVIVNNIGQKKKDVLKLAYIYEILADGHHYFTNDITYGDKTISFTNEDGMETILTYSSHVKVTELREKSCSYKIVKESYNYKITLDGKIYLTNRYVLIGDDKISFTDANGNDITLDYSELNPIKITVLGEEDSDE